MKNINSILIALVFIFIVKLVISQNFKINEEMLTLKFELVNSKLDLIDSKLKLYEQIKKKKIK